MTPAKTNEKKPVRRTSRAVKELIGWREWVGLPDLRISRIKAKIDTGARSSALHAWNVEPFERGPESWVRFRIHPLQRDNKESVTCEARVIDRRMIRSSNGHREERFVISTRLEAGALNYPIELTLTNRDEMGFRILLGRTALGRHFVVDPRRSFLLDRTSPVSVPL